MRMEDQFDTVLYLGPSFGDNLRRLSRERDPPLASCHPLMRASRQQIPVLRVANQQLDLASIRGWSGPRLRGNDEFRHR